MRRYRSRWERDVKICVSYVNAHPKWLQLRRSSVTKETEWPKLGTVSLFLQPVLSLPLGQWTRWSYVTGMGVILVHDNTGCSLARLTRLHLMLSIRSANSRAKYWTSHMVPFPGWPVGTLWSLLGGVKTGFGYQLLTFLHNSRYLSCRQFFPSWVLSPQSHRAETWLHICKTSQHCTTKPTLQLSCSFSLNIYFLWLCMVVNVDVCIHVHSNALHNYCIYCPHHYFLSCNAPS